MAACLRRSSLRFFRLLGANSSRTGNNNVHGCWSVARHDLEIHAKALCSVSISKTKWGPSFRQSCPASMQGRIQLFHTSPVFRDEIRTIMPPAFADSISEGDIRWEKAVGDQVAADEQVGEIETDKTSLPVIVPAAGVIEELLVEDGSTVTAKTPLLTLRVGATADASSTPAPAAEAPPPPPAAEETPPPPPPPAAETPPPAAPQPPPPSEASPPSETPPPPSAGPIPTTPPPAPPIPTQPISSVPVSSVTPIMAAPPVAGSTTANTETRVKMNRMRQRIAQRLKDAQNTCAMLTTFNELDMSNIMELRKTYQDAFVKKHGLKFGFMSAFIKASAAALDDQPEVNAVIDDLEIVYRNYVDISVAVATPKGLVVPVLRNCSSMSYADIEHGLSELSKKAQEGSLAIEDMDGGTFTISNGGVFGSLMGTPIINPPQSAILGMHGIFPRPIAVNGQVEIRPMMYVALTYDHRLIDGREAVTFLRKIKSAVEDPRTLLLGL